ncbi:MAG TPA: M20/M25/M40 family metallo-hydrolase [Gemmatimonadaceae bacterium]|jgi:acetylornithine deacetylase/succinyl-diaminopimelate desuccinylase-like protein
MPGRAPAFADTTVMHRSLAAAHARLAAHDDAIVRTQITVAQIAAPTGEEEERGSWVARRFRDCGLSSIKTDAAGNVVGRRNGVDDAPPVVICAHLDTVFPRDTDLSIRRDGERLVGPGINDNGRGLAVMLALAAEIDGVRLRSRHPVEFVATTGEEGLGDLRGAKHYFADRGKSAHAVLALDGAGDERIIHRALGSRRFRISYAGPGGHSWAAYGSANAVHAAAAAASRLAAVPLPASPRTTLSVGRIGGGLSVNSIPDAAWLEIDLRSTSAWQLDEIERAIRRIAQMAADDENGKRVAGTRALTVRVDPIGSRPCGETPAGHALVQSAIEATRLVGRQPDLALASTDANVPISQGIPAIAIGAGGRGGDAHTHGEWFDNLHGTVGVARALTIVMTMAQMA